MDHHIRTLCLLANEFPYFTWEAYLETEVLYYSKFEKVWCCSLQLRDEHTNTIRQVPNNFQIIPVRFVSRFQYFLKSFLILFVKDVYHEIFKLVKLKKINIRNLITLFVYFTRAHHEANIIDKKLRLNSKNNILFYSYRFDYQPYVAILLRRKWNINAKIISRAHRYDLYENKRPGNYIPMRDFLLRNIRAYPKIR